MNNVWCRLGLIAILSFAVTATACSSGGDMDPAPTTEHAPIPAELESFLQMEFDRLGIDPDKVTAAAPQGASNAVFDMYGVVMDPDDGGPLPPTSVYLSWTEVLTGDCDQNGEVNSADLTPIGLKFGSGVDYDDPLQHGGFSAWPTGLRWDAGGVPPTDPAVPGSPATNWRNSRVDTDSNGEINISDITAIAAHWQERSDGYVIYRKLAGEADFSPLPNPTDPQAVVTVGRPSPIDATRPVVMEFTDSDLNGSTGICEYYVAPYDSNADEEGTASDILQVDLGIGNNGTFDPVAVLYADPATGPAPLNMTWWAHKSYDLDGAVVNYEWDMDGDNTTWEYDSGNDPTLQLTYTQPGEFTQWVRVRDNEGHTAITFASISVGEPTGENLLPTASFIALPESGKAPLTVNFDGSASSDPDGFISRWEWDPEGAGTYPLDTGGTATAQYVYSQPGTYQAWLRVTDNRGGTAEVMLNILVEEPGPEWHMYDPSGENSPVGDISLALVDGYPAVAWSDTTNQTIHYMRSKDAYGGTWDGVRQLGTYVFNQSTIDVALVDVGGKPGIAYYSPVNAYTGSLVYVLGNDASGSTFGSDVNVAVNVSVLLGLDGEIVDGRPAFAYRDVQNDKFEFSLANDANGASWNAPVTIASNPLKPGYLCDLEIVFGRPAVIAQNKYFRAANADGTDWSGPGSIALNVGNGFHASLAVADANPAVAFYNSNLGEENLYYIRALDGPGGAWGSAALLDPGAAEGAADHGGNCSMSVFDGKPFVAYHNATAGELTAVISADDAGTAWNQPLVLDSAFIRSISTTATTQAPIVAATGSFGFKVYSYFEGGGIL